MSAIKALLAIAALTTSALVGTNRAAAADAPPVGQETYLRYCAACHGIDGRGAGPLADALKATPPDLTRIAARNGGKFPSSRVADTIRDGAIPGHGRKTMLEWGKIFGGDKDRLEATATILDVAIYVESLQAK